jgi:hypothetical protein
MFVQKRDVILYTKFYILLNTDTIIYIVVNKLPCDSIKLIKFEYTFNSSVRMMLYSDDLALSFAPLVNISFTFLLCAITIDLCSDLATKIAIVFLLSYLDKTPSKLTTSLSLILHLPYNIDNI